MNGNRLDGQSAIITGGASGIGFATARRFLEEGANVLIGDYNEEAGATAAAALAAEGFEGKISFLQADVASEPDIEKLVTSACDLYGGLDVVFNNAGIQGALGPVTEIDAEHWDATFAVMTRGVFLGVKHAARVMQQSGGGKIINMASIGGLAGGVIPIAYSAAKSAVVSLTKNAAIELAEDYIRVNCVCPGIIFTPLMHGGREAVAEAVAETVQPWPDRGLPEYVADAVLFLASDESRFITGEALVVDGGYLANGLLNVHPLHGDSEKAKQYAGIAYGLTGRRRELRKLSD
ncbi:MAG: SDR family NAD(P)-dependent oxidoreductase [Pseudomonadota bacterium]